MKKNRKSARVVFLGAFIALAVIAIAGINMRTLINNDGLMGTARKAGANDAVVGDVLENYTFTSDTAGTGIMGSITDYSQTLTQLKLLASSANQIVTLPLNPGYYTQVKLDTTEVYEAGYDDGYEKGVKDSIVEFSTNYGRIDVIWLSGTSNTVTATPNAPVLTSNGESMTPIKWNASNAIVTTTSSDSSWYSYVAGSGNDDNTVRGNTSSHWANARTANGSYFVWIPRFAYRITYYDSETSTQPTGYYDGRGMWNASNNKIMYELESGIETITYNNKEYIVHPAFNTDIDLGGWSSKISGFWIAKFEMSGNTAATLKSIFGVESQREQSTGTQYINARQATYGYTGTIDTFDNYRSFMHSHMTKNSEWGAVAYLAHSQYGRNGSEIDINGSTSCITGNGSGAVGGTAPTASGTQNAYNTETGAKASTTGNVYGVYDMSGGAWDKVALYYSEGSKTYIEGSNYGLSMIQKAKDSSGDYISTKYITKYSGCSSSYGNIVVYSYGKTGDATKEVNTGGQDSYISKIYRANWFGDLLHLPSQPRPFVGRGGSCENSEPAGVFYIGETAGMSNPGISFRTVLCP